MGGPPFGNLCDVPNVLVGHATDGVGITGCTAILFEEPAVVGVDVRGSSPGTSETDRLSPTGSIRRAHGLMLSGGSAFGLAAAEGVVRFLEEKGVGLDIGFARIPLVSSAILFDLAVGDAKARPGPEMGYEAASAARSSDFDQGSVGAGTGATVGKVLGPDRAMKGGLGSASISLGDGLVVAALAAVNAFGDVRDPKTGAIVAGPRLDDGSFADSVEHLMDMPFARWGDNTTLVVVATNADLSKLQVTKVAQMAHNGLARTISPVHTTVDGDVVFAASVPPGLPSSPDIVGAWAVRVVEQAILSAVRSARGIPGFPAISEL